MNGTNANKIIADVFDKIKTLELKGHKFYWKFSMSSQLMLKTDFGLGELNNVAIKMSEGDVETILKVFYAGIIWNQDDAMPYQNFISIFISDDKCEELRIILEFIPEALPEFLNLKKKFMIVRLIDE